MQRSLMDLFPLALLALFLVGVQPVRPLRAFRDDYLSLETGKSLRGLCTLAILLHHLALQQPSGFLFVWFQHVGYLSVSVFFFLSGYGLMRSHMTREAYSTHFLRRRIPKILVPYILLTAVYWGFHACNGTVYTPGDLLNAAMSGRFIVSYSWYILCILAFYVVFWLLMRLCKQRYALILTGTCVWYALYAAFCVWMRFGSWWYKTAPVLIVGVFWAAYEKKILALLHRRYVLFAPAVCILFLILFALFVANENAPDAQLRTSLPLTLLSCVFFVCSLWMLTLKCRIGNPVLRFLGDNALEIYLVQGLFIAGLRSHILYIRNDFAGALLSIIGSVALGGALHLLHEKMFGKVH